MTARQEVAAALEALEGWTAKPWPHVPENIRPGKAAASVWRSDLEGGPSALQLAHQVTVNIYVSPTAEAKAEDELDGRLDQALVALQRLGSFAWSRASRMVFDNDLAGWQITGAMHSPNIYREQIILESEAP